MRVERYLENTARRMPDKIALVVGDTRVSYAALDDASNRLAHALRQRGVNRGDRVVAILDNSVETVVALFAAFKAGAVYCGLNPTTKAEKLAHILNNCRAAAVVTHARLLPVASVAVEQVASVVATFVVDAGAEPAVRGGVDWRAAIADAPSQRLDGPSIDIDLAMILYTSGSTGIPKGVMLTHQNIACATESVAEYLGITSNEIILSVLPLSFGYGLNQIFTSCMMGGTVVLEKSFAYPAATVQRLVQERATGFPLVPTIAALLLKQPNLTPDRFPNLRYITNAAAALPPAHLRQLRDVFPSVRIFSMYGQTECTRGLYLPPEQLDIRPGSVGQAIPNTEAYVIDERGERLGPNHTGELVIRGAHVMKGYWENPGATERTLRPGRYSWEKVLHTGDLFRRDEEGYFYFVSRMDDIIKTRGEKVSPKEVEDVIYSLVGVREAAVFGVPDPILGQAIRAVIALTDDGTLTERDVLSHCAKHLEDFMVPRSVEFRTTLPKTDNGKIRRSEVQAEAIRVLAGSVPG